MLCLDQLLIVDLSVVVFHFQQFEDLALDVARLLVSKESFNDSVSVTLGLYWI